MKPQRDASSPEYPRFQRIEFLVAAHRLEDVPPDEGAEVAFLGRSNSGKSSAINAIAGRKGLARSSKEPGRTRQIVFFRLPGGRLADLPGFGHAAVPHELRRHWDQMVTVYLESRRSLSGVVLVSDIRRGIGNLERGFLQWCSRSSLPVLCLLSKSDKLSRSGREHALRLAAPERGKATVIPFSATTGEGVNAARLILDKWLSDGDTEIRQPANPR